MDDKMDQPPIYFVLFSCFAILIFLSPLFSSDLITGAAVAAKPRNQLTIGAGGNKGVELAPKAVTACYLKKKEYEQCCSATCIPECKAVLPSDEVKMCVNTCEKACVMELIGKYQRKEFLKYKPTVFKDHYKPFRGIISERFAAAHK